ncbi:MAG: glycoside hydrolase/phage tail family protein [Pseudomonadota bacterium]
MATVLLSAAGSAIGGSIGGSVLGVSAAAIGQAAGAVAGSLIDQAILGGGAQAVDTGRARSLRLQTSTEGAPVAQVFGRMRVAGEVIWATRFNENVRTSTQGGKGIGGGGQPRQTVREFSYSISLAFGLCEGPIDRIGRVWADGKLFSLRNVSHRIYTGTETQQPDAKIQAVEGTANVPAYRGLAYIVIENLPLERFGNRIPQFNFEVFRAVSTEVENDEAGRPVPELVQAVSISPGTGEFALDPQPARIVFPAGGGRYLNVNNVTGRSDWAAAMDQLEADLPVCRGASLVVSWFGSDLRTGHCRVEPKIEERDRVTAPEPWTVSGLTTADAPLVSRDQGDRPNFGGTPSDGAIIRAILDLKARGIKVVLYPFLLMDIAAGNGLSDPYGRAEQPPFPWRGRITLDLAPDQTGTADQTAAATADVRAFFGTADPGDFAITSTGVAYSGPDEWTWRRFVLHLASLGAAAGGVDAICIGTEMRGLTTIRSAKTAFPAVDEFIDLAADVRAILPEAKITYAADWSEYFGYQPQDGSGDVLFHLDPLWADPNIDVIGIDDYTPLSDWRHETSHLDDAAGSIYALGYLQSQVEGGEYYDYFYASDADKAAQVRSPIADGAHDEPFVFRPKDLRGWWENPHHNRIDGVRQTTPTAWQPMSKAIWLTETGCPAVDLGANQPNLFFDVKSSESGLPFGARGARDDEMQRRFLQAKLGYWQEPENNPVSPVYDGVMIPDDGVFVWTWDARPWPDFPVRESLWSDGPSHRLGHWITGRVTSGSLAAVVADICERSGLTPDDYDVSRVFGAVDGYLLDRNASGREALQPLMQAYGFDAYESAGRIVFATRLTTPAAALEPDGMVPSGDAGRGPIEREAARLSATPDSVRLSYVQSENDYRVGAAESRLPGGSLTRVSETSLELVLAGSKAQAITNRWLAEAARAQQRAVFALPPSALAYEPGDVVQLPGAGQEEQYRIDRITDQAGREVEAVRIEPTIHIPAVVPDRSLEPEAADVPGPLTVILMDLPIADGSEIDHQPWIAATADPWPGAVAVYRSSSGNAFELVSTVRAPALIGRSLSVLPPGATGRWHRVEWIVTLPDDGINAAEQIDVLNGANRMAVELPSGAWELLQFQDAELIGTDTYRLGRLLRGQRGTAALSTGAIAPGARIVVLDDAIVPLPVTAEEQGLERIWRVGPVDDPVSEPSFLEQTLAFDGAGLRPFAPVHLRARRLGGDFVFSWIRQTRIGGDSLAAVDVPLGEEIERYRLRITAGGTVLREVETEAASFTYTAAMQVADSAAGPVAIRVAQLSVRFGYGPERVIEIDV